ncbi:uncharacterized protein BX664DRAFT_341264 [Halteromyces radiatus]|uniref:uncharacterized protein n=1 Tax=Halteromyces radiatus TaxID=101107 RepID=UPI00221FA285|nr:uncharacterized protein BX664DRAFT_341264 [Halteromyces radiatus]KAI8081777.1 hypothetical protein BX664DRAFT_341264 [Halteromyces radiatus]
MLLKRQILPIHYHHNPAYPCSNLRLLRMIIVFPVFSWTMCIAATMTIGSTTVILAMKNLQTIAVVLAVIVMLVISRMRILGFKSTANHWHHMIRNNDDVVTYSVKVQITMMMTMMMMMMMNMEVTTTISIVKTMMTAITVVTKQHQKKMTRMMNKAMMPFTC